MRLFSKCNCWLRDFKGKLVVCNYKIRYDRTILRENDIVKNKKEGKAIEEDSDDFSRKNYEIKKTKRMVAGGLGSTFKCVETVCIKMGEHVINSRFGKNRKDEPDIWCEYRLSIKR